LPIALDGKNKAGQAFRNIARRLNGEQVAFMNLDENDSFLGRLKGLIRPGGN